MKIDKARVQSYPFTIRPLADADGGGFAIEYPDLPGCISDGETPEEAFRNGSDAVKAYLLSCTKHGDPIPQPSAASGQWRQRVPATLAPHPAYSRAAWLRDSTHSECTH